MDALPLPRRLAVAAGGLIVGLALGLTLGLAAMAYLTGGVGATSVSRDVPFVIVLILEAVVLVPLYGGGSTLVRRGRVALGMFLIVTCVASLLLVGVFDVLFARSLRTPAAWRL